MRVDFLLLDDCPAFSTFRIESFEAIADLGAFELLCSRAVVRAKRKGFPLLSHREVPDF